MPSGTTFRKIILLGAKAIPIDSPRSLRRGCEMRGRGDEEETGEKAGDEESGKSRPCREIEKSGRKLKSQEATPAPTTTCSWSLTAYCKASFTLSFTSPSFYICLFIHLYLQFSPSLILFVFHNSFLFSSPAALFLSLYSFTSHLATMSRRHEHTFRSRIDSLGKVRSVGGCLPK